MIGVEWGRYEVLNQSTNGDITADQSPGNGKTLKLGLDTDRLKFDSVGERKTNSSASSYVINLFLAQKGANIEFLTIVEKSQIALC